MADHTEVPRMLGDDPEAGRRRPLQEFGVDAFVPVREADGFPYVAPDGDRRTDHMIRRSVVAASHQYLSAVPEPVEGTALAQDRGSGVLEAGHHVLHIDRRVEVVVVDLQD